MRMRFSYLNLAVHLVSIDTDIHGSVKLINNCATRLSSHSVDGECVSTSKPTVHCRVIQALCNFESKKGVFLPGCFTFGFQQCKHISGSCWLFTAHLPFENVPKVSLKCQTGLGMLAKMIFVSSWKLTYLIW